MRKSVRKIMGVAVLGVLAALFALPMLGAGAAEPNGSQGSNGVNPPPPETLCTFNVAPLTITPPAQVAITGTAPTDDNTHLVLYVNGFPAVKVADSDVVDIDPNPDGSYTLLYTINSVPEGGVPLSVNFTYGNQNAYISGCTGPGGVTVIRVRSNEVVRPPAAAAAQLAFTGSSETPSYVLIGIAAVVVGAVLVVAARRRSHLS